MAWAALSSSELKPIKWLSWLEIGLSSVAHGSRAKPLATLQTVLADWKNCWIHPDGNMGTLTYLSKLCNSYIVTNVKGCLKSSWNHTNGNMSQASHVILTFGPHCNLVLPVLLFHIYRYLYPTLISVHQMQLGVSYSFSSHGWPELAPAGLTGWRQRSLAGVFVKGTRPIACPTLIAYAWFHQILKDICLHNILTRLPKPSIQILSPWCS